MTVSQRAVLWTAVGMLFTVFCLVLAFPFK